MFIARRDLRIKILLVATDPETSRSASGKVKTSTRSLAALSLGMDLCPQNKILTWERSYVFVFGCFSSLSFDLLIAQVFVDHHYL
jgi:hypothetical protein